MAELARLRGVWVPLRGPVRMPRARVAVAGLHAIILVKP